MDQLRDRLLNVRSSRLYCQLEPEELMKLQRELEFYLQVRDSKLDDISYIGLMEMLFYVEVYSSDDVAAEVTFKRLQDEFGSGDAPMLYMMKATLIEINDGEKKARKYIDKICEDRLDFDTDSQSYLMLQKKKVAMSMNKGNKSNKQNLIVKLNKLVEQFPLDAEIWTFLGELYLELGQFDKSVFCYEEVLLIQPVNFVVFAKIGEIMYLKMKKMGNKLGQDEKEKLLQDALNNCLRSVELNEFFLKGWSVIALICKQLNDKNEILTLSQKNLTQIMESSDRCDRDRETAKLILGVVA